MQFGLYLSAGGALASQAKQDVIANNIANIDTPGFKRAFAVSQERRTEAREWPRYDPSQRPVLDQIGGGLFIQEVSFDPAMGSLNQTGNSFDVAIEGEGWFTVDRAGQQLFTRAGNFKRNQLGELVTADGQSKVLSKDGNGIMIPDGNLSVAKDGSVRVDDKLVGQLWVQGQVDYKQFDPQGENLYKHVGEAPLDQNPAFQVRQGSLEASGVNAVQEMVEMIRTYRAYEANQRMITLQDQIMGRVANDVGRTG